MTDRILSVPNNTPIGITLSPAQRQLLISNQALLKTAHRAIVNDLSARGEAQFSPFGICVRSDGSHFTNAIAPRVIFPEGPKAFLSENAIEPVSMENLDLKQALAYLVRWLIDEASIGNMVTSLICFPGLAGEASRSGKVYAIDMMLENNQGTAVKCMGTYQPLAVENTWEFSDLSGIPMSPIVFSQLQRQ